MTELRDLAQQLIEARAKATPGEWHHNTASTRPAWLLDGEGPTLSDIEFITLAANNALDVIQAYQAILKRYLNIWNSREIHFPVKLLSSLSDLSKEIRKSLPE